MAVNPTIGVAMSHQSAAGAGQGRHPQGIVAGVALPVVPPEVAATETDVAVPQISDAVNEHAESEVAPNRGQFRLCLDNVHKFQTG